MIIILFPLLQGGAPPVIYGLQSHEYYRYKPHSSTLVLNSTKINQVNANDLGHHLVPLIITILSYIYSIHGIISFLYSWDNKTHL